MAQSVELGTNPGEETFKNNRETASQKKSELDTQRQENDEKLRLSKNKREDLNTQIEDRLETIRTLQKNKGNISGREAEIREDILAYLGATQEDIPFIGELIKVKETEREWETSVEKILHHFALRLVIPDKYYNQVNEYVNNTNLRGKISYQRYRGFTSLAGMGNKNIPANALIHKIEFKPKNNYTEWLEDTISKQYNYACVDDLQAFALYEEKAITKEGLIKFAQGKHEKDDRLGTSHERRILILGSAEQTDQLNVRS